jgi:hypothetical protein
MATSRKKKAEKRYRVIWEIDIEGMSSPRQAAREALRIQRDPDSVATFFIVRPMSGRIRKDVVVEL